MQMKNRPGLQLWIYGAAVASLIAVTLLVPVGYIGVVTDHSSNLFCSLSGIRTRAGATATADDSTPPIQLKAILHYATSRRVPQQSYDEIKVTFDVLKSRAPCNFLVFGLGHDSLMWASFNPRGTTLFLEEDPKWVQTVLKSTPDVTAHRVQYRTQLSAAHRLISSYRSEPYCSPEKAFLRGNTRCELALSNLEDEVYDKEWDLIMIDAPRGYFPEAPGRMGAIYTAAVMARNRKGSGTTHVFLHDVDRTVEKRYAEEFLCRKNLVNGVGRLWHFEIPPAAAANRSNSAGFC